jgi:ubiquinone/menaquinone biosynthesis C-methylase UbiE
VGVGLLDVARPQQGERLLDVACGTGVVARAAASMVSRQGAVSALDLDESNVAVARRVAEQENLNISWHTGRAEELPFPDASFELVVCQFGLMFFSDPAAALREMHRVLTPRGRLVLSTWQTLDRHPFHQAVHEATLAGLGVSTVASVFSLGEPDQLRAMVQDAGFHELGAGDFVMVPAGVPHAFIVKSATARVLGIQPTCECESFYRGASEPFEGSACMVDFARIAQSAQENGGIQIVGPPLF